MRTTRVVVLGAAVVACGFVLHVAHAQPGIRRIDLQREGHSDAEVRRALVVARDGFTVSIRR